MKSKAKVISLLLVMLISMSFVLQGIFKEFPEILAAETSNDVVKVSVSNKPTVDIVLSSKETSLDLQNFERDVLNKLKELGIDTSNIQIQTAETKQFNSNNSNAEQIFNSWRIFPDNYDANWYYDKTSKKVVCPVDSIGETGFIDDKNSYQNFTMEATIHATQLSQPEGLVFRMDEDEKTGRWNMYWLWCSGDRFTAGSVNRVIALFKTEGHDNNYLTRKTTPVYYMYDKNNVWSQLLSTSRVNATPQHRINHSQWTNHDGGTKLVPAVAGSSWTNLGDPDLKTTTIGVWTEKTQYTEPNPPSLDVYGFADIFKLKVEASGNSFKIYKDGKKIMDLKDTYGTPLYSGHVGFFTQSEPGVGFGDIKIDWITYKAYKEILNQPQWRDEAHHVVVGVDDFIDDSLGGADRAEVLSKTLNNDIHLIYWGTNTNKSYTQDFINKNDGKGQFIDNGNYSNAVNQTAQYIKNLIEQDMQSQWVIVGKKTDIDVTPSNLKTGAVSSDYRNGRWFIKHDPDYFANSEGLSSQAFFYTPDLTCTFDKPGKYEIYFDDNLVKTIYAHRIPSAAFNMKFQKASGNMMNLTLETASRDYDSNDDIGLGKGIASEQWHYREASSNTWISGKLTSFDVTKTYIIKHTVTDKQGESSYTTKYVGSGKPVAEFNYEKQVFTKYEKVEVIDSSYDPGGNPISKYQWTLKKNGSTIGTYASPITDFKSLGVGNYTYTLVVTNNKGVTSESYTNGFEIVADTKAPAIMIDPIKCSWKKSQDINVSVSDDGSGLKGWRYVFTSSNTAPSAFTGSEITDGSRTISLTDSGILYLHVKAYDKDGNAITRTAGPYYIDNVPPVINKVNKQHIYSNNTVDITITASDAHSGVVSYGISKTNDASTAEWSDSNKKTVTENGTYYLFAKDLVGNISGGNAGTSGNSIVVDEITTSVKVSINWDDDNNRHMTRPGEVVVCLNRDGVPFRQHRITGSTWEYTFDDLDIKSSSGSEYSYDITYEDILSMKRPSDGYSSSMTEHSNPDALTRSHYEINATLINVNIPGPTTPPGGEGEFPPDNEDIESPYGPDVDAEEIGYTIKGTINWVDNDDLLGYRPRKVLLTLMKDGEVFTRATVNVSGGNSFDYKFTNLPKYHDDYEVYEYTIIESFESWYVEDGQIKKAYEIDGDTKTAEYKNGDTYGIIDFTNTFIPSSEGPEGLLPAIPGDRLYSVRLQVSHDNDEILPVEFKMHESFYGDDGVTYGDSLNGYVYNISVPSTGTIIDDIKPGKYQIICRKNSLDGIDISVSGDDEIWIEKEGDAYFLYIDTVNKNISSSAFIRITDKQDTGYMASDDIKNYFAAHMELADAAIMSISDDILLEFESDKVVPEIQEIQEFQGFEELPEFSEEAEETGDDESTEFEDGEAVDETQSPEDEDIDNESYDSSEAADESEAGNMDEDSETSEADEEDYIDNDNGSYSIDDDKNSLESESSKEPEI